MTADGFPNFTQSGLPGIDRVPFGTHACHFYPDRDQLADVLVPYTIAGLRGNERCLWITALPLRAREAVEALRAAWDGTDDAIQAGALQILDFDRWYMNSSVLKGPEVVQLWLKEEERAQADGFRGLRIASNTSYVTPDDWPEFMAYEQALSASLNGRRILSLCSYGLEQSNGHMSAVMQAHSCVFDRPASNWQMTALPAQHVADGHPVSPNLSTIELAGCTAPACQS